jgi:hypothetical protein
MNKVLLLFLVFIIVGCSGSSEKPASDFRIPLGEHSSAEIVSKVAKIAKQNGFRIESNDPSQMSLLNGGGEAVSIWLFNGQKNIGNIFTVNENGNIRIMFFKSGFSAEQEISDLEMILRGEFE